jgi:hypothetical protein
MMLNALRSMVMVVGWRGALSSVYFLSKSKSKFLSTHNTTGITNHKDKKDNCKNITFPTKGAVYRITDGPKLTCFPSRGWSGGCTFFLSFFLKRFFSSFFTPLGTKESTFLACLHFCAFVFVVISV